MAKRAGLNHGIRYSEAFKMGVVREIEEKDLPLEQVRRRFGIKGKTTVLKWVRKYGRGTRGMRIRVEKPEEINELQRLRERVRRLESALADANIDVALERAYTQLACERAGIDVVEFKKKSGWAAAQTALKPRAERAPGVSVASVCRRVGMSRQNYYVQRRRRQRRAVDGELVVGLVRRERQLQPRLGTRKLHHLLKSELEQAGVRIGRDRLFEELRKRALLLEPVPTPFPHTTQSDHNLPVFKNRIKGLELKGPNQAWVSDLSYLRLREGFVYLALITDKYSRKIVGWDLGDNLEAVGCVRALERALKELPSGARPIHHSDQGSQYCCHQYVNRLRERGLTISMTESNHCAENALAERMNGILKQEYGLGAEFPSKAAALEAVRQAIWLYNTKRPHTALDYEVPEAVHQFGLN